MPPGSRTPDTSRFKVSTYTDGSGFKESAVTDNIDARQGQVAPA